MCLLTDCCLGDPISVDLDRQSEWDEAIRLHFYNHENELLLHGEWVWHVRCRPRPLTQSTYSTLAHTHTYSIWRWLSYARSTVWRRRQWVTSYVYMHTPTQPHTPIHTHTHTHTHTRLNVHYLHCTCPHTHTHTLTHTYLYTLTHTHISFQCVSTIVVVPDGGRRFVVSMGMPLSPSDSRLPSVRNVRTESGALVVKVTGVSRVRWPSTRDAVISWEQMKCAKDTQWVQCGWCGVSGVYIVWVVWVVCVVWVVMASLLCLCTAVCLAKFGFFVNYCQCIPSLSGLVISQGAEAVHFLGFFLQIWT